MGRETAREASGGGASTPHYLPSVSGFAAATSPLLRGGEELYDPSQKPLPRRPAASPDRSGRRLCDDRRERRRNFRNHSRPVQRSRQARAARSEEHTSELQSLMRISYAVFCLKQKTQPEIHTTN